MAALTDSLAIAIRQRSTWKLGQPVGSVERRGDGWEVTGTKGERERVNAIVAAAPAPRVATMIEPLSRDAAAALRRIEFVSNISVSLGYERAAIGHELNASGFVVDAAEQMNGLRACAFSSSKFPGRAPEQRALLRAFFRPDSPNPAEDDRVWRERAARLLAPILEVSQPPLGAWVARWPDTLPQYSADHRGIVEEVTRLMQKVGRIQLAGTSYHPSGVPGSIRSGRAAARAILAS
jgi:oxygen-dependent protoporphyrinogen oxidase